MAILTTSEKNIYEISILNRKSLDEKKKLDSINGALALRHKIENIVDEICSNGYKNIFYMGIGGTYASSMQVLTYVEGKSEMPIFISNAAEYNTSGNCRIREGTVIIVSSVSGTTKEIIKSLENAKSHGAKIFGFIDKADTPIEAMCDWSIIYPENEQLKFFMVANRFMYKNNEFPQYVDYNENMDKYLAKALIDVEKNSESFGKEFAENHYNDKMHYFVASGTQWGATYSYAMCFWEEQLWIKTKSIHSCEFFHGTFEIIDRDVPVTVFIGEDEQRELGVRVAKFLPRVTSNYTIIDVRDYANELSNIKLEYRGSISHLVMKSITARIDAYMEIMCRHPMEIRRYYNKLDY